MSEPQGLRIDRKSTSDQAAAALREQILQGQLRPGTPLQEVSLATAFGISRNTMRESLRLLVYEGLVQHTPHRGAAVMALTETDVADIYGVRRLLELAAVNATRDAPTTEFELLGEIVEEMGPSSLARDWPRTVELDMRFHQCLVEFLRSERMSNLLQTTLAELRLALVLVDRADSDNAAATQVSEHRTIADLVAQGRQGECAEVLLRHLNSAEAKLRAVVAIQPDASVVEI